MAYYFPAQAKIHPSFSEPDLIITYAQPSGAFHGLESERPRVKIGSSDLAVYINRLDIRTETLSAQSPGNLLPSATLTATYEQTATYNIRARATYDRSDMGAAAAYAIGLPMANDLAMRQGINQQMRTALLYGFNAANGEGFLNTAGATSVTLPADSYGATTFSAYDNGEMALFMLSEIVSMKTRMFQWGLKSLTNRVAIIGPQEILMQMIYGNVVQLVAYQRPGAGVSTTGEMIKDLGAAQGDVIEFCMDDTLKGKGAGGTDMVIVTIPEIEAPTIPGINTNIFGDEMRPVNNAVNLMYADMAAPMKIPSPMPDGAITEIQELRVSSGWCIRPQGMTLISMAH